jgi:hypothetical protein
VDASITTNQLSNLSKVEETVGKFFLTMRQWLWRRKRDRTNRPNIRQMPTPVGVRGHSPKKSSSPPYVLSVEQPPRKPRLGRRLPDSARRRVVRCRSAENTESYAWMPIARHRQANDIDYRRGCSPKRRQRIRSNRKWELLNNPPTTDGTYHQRLESSSMIVASEIRRTCNAGAWQQLPNLEWQ